MLLAIQDVDKCNENGRKIIEFFNKDYNPENGLVGDKINQYIGDKTEILNNNIDKAIDELANKVGDKIGSRLSQFFTNFSSDLLQLVSLGVIGYSLYQTINMMFLGNKSVNGNAKPSDKILLGYFVFFILRILNTVIVVRGGFVGK